jgi:N-acetylglucosamine-6-sulfatase
MSSVDAQPEPQNGLPLRPSAFGSTQEVLMPRVSTRVRPALPLLLLSHLMRGRAAAQPVSRPNVVVILLDDLDQRTAQSMAGAQRLAAEGRSFPNYIVTTPGCSPSRATFLRGQYTHNHGVLRSNGKTGGFQRFHDTGDEESTIATWLQAAGYRTGHFGKYFNGYPGDLPPTYVPPGWTDWRANTVGADGQNNRNYYRYTLNENGTVVAYQDRKSSYATDVNARQAQEFMRGSVEAGQPFFAYLPLRAPHSPAQPARTDIGAFYGADLSRSPAFDKADVSDKPVWIQRTSPITPEKQAAIDEFQRARLETLLSVDRLIDSTIATLEELGQLDSTYLIFTSDNGYHLGEHRQAMEKGTPYEESINVPLIVRGPGIEPGSIETRLVSGADLAPTIADLAGAEPPDFVDGRSIRPLLNGTATPWRDGVLARTFREPSTLVYVEGALQFREAPVTVDEESDEEQDDDPKQPQWMALRTENSLYAEFATGEREYYDLVADPWQLDNAAAALSPAELVTLSARLQALVTCAGATCRTADSPDDPARESPPPLPVIDAPLPFTALELGESIELEGHAYDGAGNLLPPQALSWEVVQHSVKGEQERMRDMIGSPVTLEPGRSGRGRRNYKSAWLQITLTATDDEGRSRSTSIAYGLAPPPGGIPGRP